MKVVKKIIRKGKLSNKYYRKLIDGKETDY